MRTYLDHAATSPMQPDTIETYVAALSEAKNPASTHSDGQQASVLLEEARFKIAQTLDCDTVEVTFTSGGTESVNLAVKGLFEAANAKTGAHKILLPKTEHHATLEAAQWLETNRGATLVWLPVTGEGVVTPQTLAETITAEGKDSIALVTFLWANNEVGSIADVAGLVAVANEHGINSHVDAVAALGQVDINFKEIGASCLSVSAHKIGGPPGVGALLIDRKAKLEGLFHGGSQERYRAGSQNVAGAHAFAHALSKVYADKEALEAMRNKRDRLIEEVRKRVPQAVLRGADPLKEGARLPGNAHFTFPDCQGDSLLFLMDAKGVSVSVGSACQAGVQEISHVLLAMGIPEVEAIGSLRITLSPQTTDGEIDSFLQNLPGVYEDAKRAGITSIDLEVG